MLKKFVFRVISVFFWLFSLNLMISLLGLLSMDFLNAGIVVSFLIIGILAIYIGYLFWRRSSIDTMPSKLKNYNKKPKAKVNTINPSLVNVTVKSERELPKHVYRDMPKFYTDMQLQNDLRILEESVHLMKTTKNIETFIGRYELAQRTALTIEQAMAVGIKVNQSFIMSKEILKLRDELIPVLLDNSFAEMKKEASKLKTEKGRLGRYEKFLELLEEHELDFDIYDNYHEIVEELKKELTFS